MKGSYFSLTIILLVCLLILLGIIFIKNQEYFTENNLEQKLTICIKTIYRKQLLDAHLSHIRKILPTIKIIVTDDSDDDYKKQNKQITEKYNNVEYIPVPYDSGLSKCRNIAVERVTTEYVMIVDDSKGISHNNNNILNKIIQFMDTNKYSVVCGTCLNRSYLHSVYTHKLIDIKNITTGAHLLNNKKIALKSIKSKTPLEVRFKFIDPSKSKPIVDDTLKLYNIDLGGNYFIAKTNVIRKFKWNNDLKLSEHEDFFLKLYLNNVSVLFCDKLEFVQFDRQIRNYDKQNMRNREHTFKNSYFVKFKMH